MAIFCVIHKAFNLVINSCSDGECFRGVVLENIDLFKDFCSIFDDEFGILVEVGC
jgi:hypothetical protein